MFFFKLYKKHILSANFRSVPMVIANINKCLPFSLCQLHPCSLLCFPLYALGELGRESLSPIGHWPSQKEWIVLLSLVFRVLLPLTGCWPTRQNMELNWVWNITFTWWQKQSKSEGIVWTHTGGCVSPGKVQVGFSKNVTRVGNSKIVC